MAVVVDFDRGIDAEFNRLIELAAVLAGDGQHKVLARLNTVAEASDGIGFGAVEAEGLRADAVGELEREHAHANEVGAMDAFEALCNDSFDSQEAGAFRGPVTAGASAVFVSGEDDERGAFGLIFHAGIVDGHLFTARLMDRETAFDTGAVGFGGNHEVFDSHIREGATGHDAVVATAAAVAVEIDGFDAVFNEVFSGRRAGFDRAGR